MKKTALMIRCVPRYGFEVVGKLDRTIRLDVQRVGDRRQRQMWRLADVVRRNILRSWSAPAVVRVMEDDVLDLAQAAPLVGLSIPSW